MDWKDLSIAEKAKYIRNSVRGGVYGLKDIVDGFNRNANIYAYGTPKLETDDSFTVRDNTRVAYTPQNLGFVPAKGREFQDRSNIRLDDNVFGYVPGIGDALQAAQAWDDFKNKDYLNAAIGASLLAVPNLIEKPLKMAGKFLNGFLRNRRIDDAFVNTLSNVTGKKISRIPVSSTDNGGIYTHGFKYIDNKGKEVAHIFGDDRLGNGVFVESSFVTPEYRRMGIGKQMYLDFNNNVFKDTGKTLRSSPYQHQLSIETSPGSGVFISPSSKLWKGFKNNGLAHIEGSGLNKYFVMENPNVINKDYGGPLNYPFSKRQIPVVRFDNGGNLFSGQNSSSQRLQKVAFDPQNILWHEGGLSLAKIVAEAKQDEDSGFREFKKRVNSPKRKAVWLANGFKGWKDDDLRYLYDQIRTTGWDADAVEYAISGETNFMPYAKSKYSSAIGLGQMTKAQSEALFGEDAENIRKQYEDSTRTMKDVVDDTMLLYKNLYDRISTEPENMGYGRIKVNLLAPNASLDSLVPKVVYDNSLTKKQKEKVSLGQTTYRDLARMYDEEFKNQKK